MVESVFKKAVLKFMAYHLVKKKDREVVDKWFKALDRNYNGVLDYEDLRFHFKTHLGDQFIEEDLQKWFKLTSGLWK